MKQPKDLTGQRFGRLVVQWPVGRIQHKGLSRILWLCLCDCGNLHIVRSSTLVSMSAKSCGCLNEEQRRVNLGISQIVKQVPGQSYTFINKRTGEQDTGLLPKEFGISNKFAVWRRDSRCERGGVWNSKKFRDDSARQNNLGIGPQGLLGRMKHIIASARWHAEERGHAPIKTSPEEMLQQWRDQHGVCKACHKPLTDISKDTVYDHDHETGLGRGFVHSHCNIMEGFAGAMSDSEFLNFVRYVRPGLLETESFFASLGL